MIRKTALSDTSVKVTFAVVDDDDADGLEPNGLGQTHSVFHL